MTSPPWLPIRWRYAAILVVFVCLLVVFVIATWLSEEVDLRLASTIQAVSAVAAATAAVIALAVADLPQKQVQIEVWPPQISPEDRRGCPYNKAAIPDEHRGAFAHYPDCFLSYRVTFRLINQSGFDLKKPVITVEVPVDRRHPALPREGKWSPSLNNNLMPMGPAPWVAEGAKSIVITGTAPYDWLQGHEREFYVRLVLDNGSREEFPVFIYVTCENAQGFHKKQPIGPQQLLPAQEEVEGEEV